MVRAVDPDADLLCALHDEFAGPLLGFVRPYVDDDTEAEDVVQETLLKAWKNVERLDLTTGNPGSYLFTIARNVLTDRWRAAQRRPRLVSNDVEVAAVPAVDDIARVVESLVVADALRRLTAEHRQVIAQLYFRGLSVQEAAALLSLPPGTVKSRSYYAVRALRAVFEEMGVTR